MDDLAKEATEKSRHYFAAYTHLLWPPCRRPACCFTATRSARSPTGASCAWRAQGRHEEAVAQSPDASDVARRLAAGSAAVERGLEYSYEHIPLGPEKPAWYAEKINPRGTVPSLKIREGKVRTQPPLRPRAPIDT